MISALISDHSLLVAVMTLSTTLIGGLFGTLKWHMWRRTKLEATEIAPDVTKIKEKKENQG